MSLPGVFRCGILPVALVAASISGAFGGDQSRTPSDRPMGGFLVLGSVYAHEGGGHFVPVEIDPAADGTNARKPIDLRRVEHEYDPSRDPDIPIFTDVTLPGITPELIDLAGRRYALITLYNIDPPLSDIPSAEAGIDRGIDFRDPANVVKSAYSNYVSPVLTDDRERRPVPGHPIGHFYVKAQIPGYPPLLTGMTTIARADEELVDLTMDRKLGLGGVLLTRQPGRLNSAVEATEELQLRQRRLVVVDGINYRREGGRNVGPVYTIEDGNVVFARFRLPVENAEDALNVFLEFVARGLQNRFGSLLSRPNRGTGAGCSAFAMMWLKAAGVIPVIDETVIDRYLVGDGAARPFWVDFYHRVEFPWSRIGCDDRVGLATGPREAQFTIHDELFHGLDADRIVAASEGLEAKIREDSGAVVGTLFSYGVLTPLRDLVIRWKRHDPSDVGDYSWAAPGEGLPVGFWDNGRFSAWVKSFWRADVAPEAFADLGIRRAREGRFLGVEIDALSTPRISAEFYRRAQELAQRRDELAKRGVVARSCRDVFFEFSLE